MHIHTHKRVQSLQQYENETIRYNNQEFCGDVSRVDDDEIRSLCSEDVNWLCDAWLVHAVLEHGVEVALVSLPRGHQEPLCTFATVHDWKLSTILISIHSIVAEQLTVELKKSK